MLKVHGLLLATSMAFAQQQAPPKPADYAAALAVLKSDAPSSPVSPAKSSRPSARRKQAPTIQGTVNSIDAIEMQRQIPLSPSARMALSLSEGWLTGGATPVQAADGRVLYTYGQGVPVIVCAILQVCELDLQAGETPVHDALDWGDHRFEVASRTSGSGSNEFTYLVFKPQQAGLDTTLTVGTNKRPYYVRLVSTSHDHMARVAFRYPQEEEDKRQAAVAAKKEEEERAASAAENLRRLSTVKPLRNWNYHIQLHGKDAAYLRPEKIADDGVHTHISLSEEARHRGLPVVQLKDARGPIPANRRWDGNELIVDAVFAKACLLAGAGRHQQRACITNEGLTYPRSASHGN